MNWEALYKQARRTAGFAPVRNRTWFDLTGKDRRSFLHGMVVSDVHGAGDLQWTVSAMLNTKGRLVADLALYFLPGAIRIELEKAMAEAAVNTLQCYTLQADARFENLSGTWTALDVVGPDACRWAGTGPAPGTVIARPLEGEETWLARTDRPMKPSLRWLVPAGLLDEAIRSLEDHGLVRLPAPAAEALRIEAGLPVFGVDVTGENLVLEVPAWRSGVSFSKGCYIGQETVARLHSRGENIARTLRGVLTEREPARGTALIRDSKEAGTVTSTTWSPATGRFLSLAMIHRSAMEPGTVVQVGDQSGTVTALPFQEG